jgi:hypothetical protein
MTTVATPTNTPAEPYVPLRIRTYKVAADGTRYDDSGVIEFGAEEVAAHACRRSATWPPCACPRHRD